MAQTPVHIVCPHCNRTNRLPADKIIASGKCGNCKQALFTGDAFALSQQNFDPHIKRNDLPVLVDFWAPWCDPCKMMAPILSQAASQLQLQIRVAKVNTESEQQLAAMHQIRSIPTLAIFKAGKEVARTAGAMDLSALTNWVQKNIR